jgi:hypothetical protein
VMVVLIAVACRLQGEHGGTRELNSLGSKAR